MEQVIVVKSNNMKKFIVGYINFFDNNLIIEIVEAEDWHDAIFQHSKIKNGIDDRSYISNETLEDAKEDAFDMDMMIDVIELN